jgi:UDP-N-acetylmuramyl pentapeptide phosphotransferase/UDP-N-acetylglucosamine-1-phosphate transferase
LVSIILGTADDVFEIGWYYKLIIQLILAVYIAIIFWGRIENIVFYNYYIPISQSILFVIFIFWFVGVYNAVNLLDGLDGLAGGFMLLVCIGTAFSGNENFVILNLIFACLIFGFLIFNQRPADLFMGDSGSLFLGYHTAVLPLLYYDNQIQITTFSMTPFILVASYLIADTTRVFVTRILSNKSPMTADTIHFHHLVYQQSGSYLASTSSIYLITMFSVVVAALSFQQTLSSNMMIIHLSLLLFFILVPPVQTYVPIISFAITPIYSWQKNAYHLNLYY